ncbi:hypothetical protein Rxyl_0666 [Rubrobacter xylanophilus DSM 9941]|uniref:Uncharacterized protein n=1 Tax=Rubrobacter xylanophilus (strain DSM 9941 / JCM 11954 / NBRC 16129 / PRD-1) TaxID=266117 RepID=Q1AY92_RUBXD|nr:hypothetical protein [Rubrobacter xylanophilus]ABG03636.1 hypothetical protein Rxyl_0666 [Rubrobacter xylanophilus DSM 9941]
MDRRRGGIRWGAVALGWLVAVLAGIVISPALRLLYGAAIGPELDRGELTAGLVAVSMGSGFLAYLVGGYAAARMAGGAGGTHGALTAVYGLVVGVVLGVVLGLLGLVFVEGVALPPATFGLAGEALVAGLVLFVVNLVGGYAGGRLGAR